MALQKQVLELPMGGTLDESISSAVMDPAHAFLTLQNVAQDVRNGSVQKRLGTTSLGSAILTGGNIAKTLRGGSRRQSGSWVIDGHYLYDYSSTLAQFVQVDRVPEPQIHQATACEPGEGFVPKSSGTVQGQAGNYDVCICNGYRIVTYATVNPAGLTTSLYAVVQDVASGTTISQPTFITSVGTLSSSNPPQYAHKVVALSTVVWLYAASSGGDLQRWKFDTANPTAGWVNFSNIAFGASVVSPYIGEFAVCGGTTLGALLINDNTNELRIFTFDAAGTLSNIHILFAGGTYWPIAVAGSPGSGSNYLWIAWLDSTVAASPTLFMQALDPTTMATLGTAVNLGTVTHDATGEAICGGIAITSSTTATLVASRFVSLTSTLTFSIGVTVTAGACVQSGVLASWPLCAMMSQPICVDGRVMAVFADVPINSVTNTQAKTIWSFALCDVTTFTRRPRPVANLASALCAPPAVYQIAPLPNIAQVSTTKFTVVTPIKKNAVAYALDAFDLDFTALNRWQPAELGDVVNMSGGVATYYDGAKVAEQNFISTPFLNGYDVSGAGSLAVGTYGFICIFEQVDAAGNVHWSAPSPAKSIAIAASKQAVLTFCGTQLTARQNVNSQNPVTMVLYMTQQNGSIYYRVQSLEQSNSGGVAVFTVSVQPTGAEQQCYTQPGTVGTYLPRQAPPGLSCLIQHGDGLVGVAPDGFTLYFSSEHVSGEGFWWSPALFAIVEDTSGVVALASFDGHLYAFTKAAIWCIDGQGFASNGNGGFAPPYKLASDVGCSEPRSVVVCPQGVLFRSEYGIMLLNRAGEASYMGQAVQDTLAAAQIITSATLDRSRHLVIFSCFPSETPGTGGVAPGKFITWDYTDGQWATWLVTDAFGTTNAAQSAWIGLTASGAPQYMYSTPNGTMYQTAATWLDAGAWVTMQAETAWIKMGGLQGFQRIWRLLLSFIANTPSDLLIEFAFDDGAYGSESATFTAPTIAAMSPTEAWHHFKHQKCRKFKIRLTDATPTTLPVGTGQGATWLGLRALYGVKSKTPMTQGSRG